MVRLRAGDYGMKWLLRKQPEQHLLCSLCHRPSNKAAEWGSGGPRPYFTCATGVSRQPGRGSHLLCHGFLLHFKRPSGSSCPSGRLDSTWTSKPAALAPLRRAGVSQQPGRGSHGPPPLPCIYIPCKAPLRLFESSWTSKHAALPAVPCSGITTARAWPTPSPSHLLPVIVRGPPTSAAQDRPSPHTAVLRCRPLLPAGLP